MSRRRTLIASEIPNLQFETDEVDDDAEKRRRVSERFDSAAGSAGSSRQRRLQQNRLQGNTESDTRSSINKTPVVAAASSTAAPKPSNEQLSSLYNNCVKLLNENKINAKNAFQLKLIDYMSDIVLNSEISGGVTNFQVVGCTIDVGSKIYAARVDALHHNTYQVLSGLNHQSAETGDAGAENGADQVNDGMGDDNMDDENDNDPNSKKAKAAKKRRLKKSSHIVTAENMDQITLKMRDEYKDEDLYFAKKSTCIENEAIGGILLNKLHVQNDSLWMLINSDDQPYVEAPRDCQTEGNFKSLCDAYTSSSIDLRNLKLCADLSNFKFIDYHLDENADMSKLVESINIAPDVDDELEAHRFDSNNLQMSSFDKSLQMMPGDNIDIDDCCQDFDNDVENMEMDPDNNAPRLAQHLSGLELLDDMRVANSISDLSTLISTTPSDYSYFNFDKLKILNLPKHLKHIANSIAAESPNYDPRANAVVQRNARNTKRVAPRIEFTKMKIDQMKLFKITKKAIYLCDRTIEKRSEKPSRLETERQLNYVSRELFQPYHKKTTAKIINNINSDELIENLLNNDEAIGMHKHNNNDHNTSNGRGLDMDDDDIGGMDGVFEIPCTAATCEPFFTQGDGDGDGFPSTQVDNQIEMMPQGDMQNISAFDGGNLIQAPLQVNALNIEYAKTSKNIDVRRLKQVIWNLLSNKDVDKENINNSANDTNNSLLKQKSSALEINASLKTIYKQLIPPLVSQRVYDDLSICIVFQMILFLANEHNLLLENDSMGFDVQITNVF